MKKKPKKDFKCPYCREELDILKHKDKIIKKAFKIIKSMLKDIEKLEKEGE